MSFIRKVVKYHDSEGRKHREVVKHASPDVRTSNLKGITDVISEEILSLEICEECGGVVNAHNVNDLPTDQLCYGCEERS